MVSHTPLFSCNVVIVGDPPIAQLARAELTQHPDNEVKVFDNIEDARLWLADHFVDAVICQQKHLEKYGQGRIWRNSFYHFTLIMLVETAPVMRGSKPFDRYVDGVISLSELNLNAILREVRNAMSFNQLQGQFREVLDKNPDGIVIVDTDGEIIYVNQATSQLFRRNAASMIGEPFGIPMGKELSEIDLPGNRTAELRMVSIEWMGEEATLTNIRDITAHKKAERSLAHAAAHDSLTALPNRAHFQKLLAEAIADANRTSSRVAVLFIDLDKFKEVNDTLGHDAGDQLLQTVADRLRADSRENTVVARLGGDEFIMLVRDIREGGELILANRLLEDLKRPFSLGGQDVNVGASIGVATYPEAGKNAHTLVMAADAAMYNAKESGRNNVKVYASHAAVIASRRQQVESEIRSALNLRQLSVNYQPLFDVYGNRTRMAEALIRWNSPTLGLIPPDEFIPLSESGGWVEAIGRWCIVEVCRQLSAWRRDTSLIYRPEIVSVNVSVNQIKDRSLPPFIERVLNETGVSTDQLWLEITETAFVHNIDDCYEIVEDLRALGIKLVLDEFGTGFLPADEIAQMPVDVLKIDKSFIAGLDAVEDSRRLISNILQVAHAANMEVVAVGVERAEALETLIELGFDYVQGYLFSESLSGDNVAEFQ